MSEFSLTQSGNPSLLSALSAYSDNVLTSYSSAHRKVNTLAKNPVMAKDTRLATCLGIEITEIRITVRDIGTTRCA